MNPPLPPLAAVTPQWQTVYAIDSDAWATRTYAANFPGVPVRTGKVSDYIDELPSADIIIGGPPCQPYSLAGDGEGADDLRDCIPDYVAAVLKVRPRMFLMENVPGLLSAKHIGHLGKYLQQLDREGYEIRHMELDAVNFGVPQFRNRVWVWGICKLTSMSDGIWFRWPRATHAWPAPTPCAWGGELDCAVSAFEAIGVDGAFRRIRGKGMTERYGMRRDQPTNEPSPTLGANTAQSGDSIRLVVNGKLQELTVAHRRRLMSAPDDFQWPADIRPVIQKKILGNGWASRMGTVFAEAFACADPKSRTMVDLFCGGGLGACGWHGRYSSYERAMAHLAEGGAH